MEILTVQKEEFKNILEEFLGEQQREITKCLKKFAYFKNWDHRAIVECCILSRIISYGDNTLIMGGNFDDSDNSYFIIEGSCQVLYHMQVQQNNSRYIKKKKKLLTYI